MVVRELGLERRDSLTRRVVQREPFTLLALPRVGQRVVTLFAVTRC